MGLMQFALQVMTGIESKSENSTEQFSGLNSAIAMPQKCVIASDKRFSRLVKAT
jgi:hypothetical protein